MIVGPMLFCWQIGSSLQILDRTQNTVSKRVLPSHRDAERRGLGTATTTNCKKNIIDVSARSRVTGTRSGLDWFQHFSKLGSREKARFLIEDAGMASSMSHRFRPPPVFVNVYLKLPWIWPLVGRQFFIVAEKV
jgi:hypothetical protein